METKKISLDLDVELYSKLKHETFNQRITMAKAIRELLSQKYGDTK